MKPALLRRSSSSGPTSARIARSSQRSLDDADGLPAERAAETLLPVDRFDPASARPPPETWTRWQHPAHGSTVWVSKDASLVHPRRLPPAGLDLGLRRVGGAKLGVMLIGDSGKADPIADGIARAMADTFRERGAHLSLHNGDMAYPIGIRSADDPKAEALVFERFAPVTPMYLALGNHEYGCQKGAGNPEAWPGATRRARASGKDFAFPCRYYRFAYATDAFRVDFFVLDTSVFAFDPAQQRWIGEALGRSRADWRVVLGHHPFLSSGKHGVHPELQAQLLPLLEQHGVDLYLAGHEHDQQVHHGRPLEIVSGGGARSKDSGPCEAPDFSAFFVGYSHLEFHADRATLTLLDASGCEDGRAPRDAHTVEVRGKSFGR